tara:strand:+ start:2315 stop:2434 length:120 start_codon:yes stop_codon:yes gene_type:complete
LIRIIYNLVKILPIFSLENEGKMKNDYNIKEKGEKLWNR